MFIWSCTAVVDRYALFGRITSKRFYVILPTLLQFPLVLILYHFFKPTDFDIPSIIASIGGGMVEVVLLYYLFVATSAEEVGRVFSLMSLSALVTLIGGYLFLSESLHPQQLASIILLLTGATILSFKRLHGAKKKYSLSQSLAPVLMGSILSSGYTLLLRFAFTHSNFVSGFFFSRLGFFIGGLIILFVWRSEIRSQWKVLTTKMRIVVIGNQAIAFSGHMFYYLALSLASAVLVQSVLAAQGVIVLLIASIVSYINPKLVGEAIDKVSFVQKSIGVLLVCTGITLLA